MVLSEINVTPLVDVMLVLLIMFMVTAPLLQQGIEVEVPQTSGGGIEIKEEPLRLVVTANKKISIAKAPITLEALRPKLSAILKDKKNKQVFIEADHRVDYGFVAQIMSEVKVAGATSLGLITQPPQ
jgi:biopolymer transport protein TolR